MPAISKAEAVDKLATAVEKAKPDELEEIFSELFPTRTRPAAIVLGDIIKHIKVGLEPEEIVDLWNVVFPDDHNVWYNEEDELIRYNEEAFGYVD